MVTAGSGAQLLAVDLEAGDLFAEKLVSGNLVGEDPRDGDLGAGEGHLLGAMLDPPRGRGSGGQLVDALLELEGDMQLATAPEIVQGGQLLVHAEPQDTSTHL